MVKALESQFRQIKLLLVIAISLLALQFVPYQAVKDVFGQFIFFGSIIVGGIYAVLLVLDTMVKIKIGDNESELGKEYNKMVSPVKDGEKDD